jgi:hypothetical protein
MIQRPERLVLWQEIVEPALRRRGPAVDRQRPDNGAPAIRVATRNRPIILAGGFDAVEKLIPLISTDLSMKLPGDMPGT